MSEQNIQPVFSLDKIYIKDLSLEVPNAPQIFLNREQPNIELNISFNTVQVEEGVYQTVLHAVVNAKIGEQQMFLIELDQAGIFQLRNIPTEQMDLIQNIECPNMLFPYLREAVTDVTTRAGFLPVILTPINFAYLYQQKQAQEAANAAGASVN
ncbi:MAG: protein-export chaperone SecB [Proteobacteria bacterium]|nr:MAG: protein-export chaperone SecB [Pseudomonadota bacterium]